MISKEKLPKDFDWNFYLRANQDLINAGIKTEPQAINHYLNNGIRENRIYTNKNNSIYFRPTPADKISIYKNLCEKLLKYLEPTFPVINKNSKNKSVIVETRWDKQIEFTIKNTIQKLGNEWGHIIFCNEENYNKIVNLKNEISEDIEIINLGNYKVNRNSYNNLLLSLDFWNQIDCEKVLVYQWDSFIFKKFDNSFLEWDYVGAPWDCVKHIDNIKKQYNFDIDVYIGNGGLSLRSVNAMKDILKLESPVKNHENSFDYIFEDLFFSYHLTKKNYKISSLETAKKFSFEHRFENGSFGCHQPFVDSSCDFEVFEGFLKKFIGFNVYGFANSDSGLGQNMRTIIKVLDQCKILYNINIAHPNRVLKNDYVNENFNYFNNNLILCNPDWDFIKFLGNDYFDKKYNISLWAWEIEKLPNKWVETSKYFDEIWTISNFCKESFEKSLPNKKIEVLNIPTIFLEKKDKQKSKEKFNLQNKFICLFIFDYQSDVVRKNPFDSIRAFELSLGKKDDCVFIIKTHNCDDNMFLNSNKFKQKNIILINENFTKEQMSDLFNCADIYISLHRSEGSGLTIMEAINLEIPVVCTNYSGNLDFCDENCQLVDYFLTPIKNVTNPTYKEFEKYFFWGQPKIEDASEKLIEVYNNYDLYKNKIKKTKEKMLNKFNLFELGNFIKNKI